MKDKIDFLICLLLSATLIWAHSKAYKVRTQWDTLAYVIKDGGVL